MQQLAKEQLHLAIMCLLKPTETVVVWFFKLRKSFCGASLGNQKCICNQTARVGDCHIFPVRLHMHTSGKYFPIWSITIGWPYLRNKCLHQSTVEM